MPQMRSSGRRWRGVFAGVFAKTSMLLLASFAATQTARAQVTFTGVQTTLGSGFVSPFGVAVAGNGNVFVGDTGNNQVKEILAVNGSIPANPTISVLGSGLNVPRNVALDTSGNVYVADSGNNAVKEILAVGGYTTVNTLGSGFNGPDGVAVDGAGNVFVADTANGAVKEILVAGGYTTVNTLATGFEFPDSVALDGAGNVFVTDTGNGAVKEILAAGGYTTVNTLATGLGFPHGVAVDASENVYVAEFGNNTVIELLAVGGYATVSTLGSGFNGPDGVAVDGRGNVYVADSGNNRIVELSLTSVNFGAEAVGTASAAVSLPFTIEAGTTVGSIPVLTTGGAGLDFAHAGTGTCTIGNYAATTNCTVNVTFTPLAPGGRNGAVEILDGAGNVLASVYVYGTGTGPAVVFSPVTPTTLGSGFNEPTGVAKDGSGNVFVADTFNNEIKEIPAGGGTPTVLGIGFGNPFGVAVDGAGNVFVADTNNNAVKEILAASGYVTVNNLGSGFLGPYGVTVDGSGNVYVADTGNSLVKEILAFGGYTTVLTLGSGFNQPEGVAEDGSGNVFVADTYNQEVKEILAASGYTTVNTLVGGFNFPRAVALDASGNLYVADSGNNEIKQILAAGGYTTINILAAGLSQPYGVTVGGSGNVFFSNSGANLVEELPSAQPPPLAFGPTNVGTTSSSSPLSATVQNVGNAALTVTGLTFSDGIDFAQVAGPGTPGDCSGTIVLAAGVECNLSVNFTPQSVGLLAGTVTLTDDSLNTPGSTQAIALSGTGVALTQTITFNPIPSQVLGTSLNLTLYASASSGLAVSFASTTPTICTVAGTTATMTAAGNCSIQASQTGNADYSPATPVMQAFAVNPPATTGTTLAVISGGNAVTTVAPGSAITLSAAVIVGGAPVTAGLVNFCDATAVYCAGVSLLGSAQLTASGTAAFSFVPGIGSHSYKAIFTGTLFNAASSSAASPLTVTGSFATTSTLAVAVNAGANTFTATVVGTGSSLSPTGAVAFLDATNGNSSLGTAALSAGSLTQTFAPQVPYGTGLIPQAVAVGDFNRDGIPDLAVANSVGNAVSVLLGNPNGTFQGEVTYPTGTYGSSVAVGDFNGDGFPDLAVTNLSDNTVSVLLGNGNGTFQNQVAYPVQSEPVSVAVGDFNGDGFPDLAIASAGSSNVSVLLGTGNGAFNPEMLAVANSLLSSVAVGDFNGDGILDLAVTEAGGTSVEVLPGKGDGTFNPEVSYGTGNNPQSVGVGDFNGDGILDLAVANHNDNTLSVLLGKGDGTFSTQATNATGINPQSVVVGDFNADGILDIAAANAGGNTVSVLLGKGDGTFNAQTPYASGNTPFSVVTGDFNGDGVPDLAVLNQGSNSVSVLLSQLTQTATASLANVTVQGTGTHNIAASYAGDANYAASLSQTVPVATVPYPQAAQPVFNPGTGTYGAVQTVTITDATQGATIYYTTDGTIPTTASGVYTAPIPVNTTETLNAIAAAANFTTSTVATATITILIPPSITTPPANQTIVSGQTATLTVVATGTAPLTYQWYQGMSPNTANPVVGATAASFTTPPLTATASYWVQVSNGSANPAQSATATVTVVTPPSIVSQPDTGLSEINPGQTATITVVATGTQPLTYQWFQGTSPVATNPIAGAVNSTYTTPPLTVATSYWVQVSNFGGVVNSATLLVYVNQPPVCTLNVAGTSTPLAVNATVSCSDPQNELLTATINWGDGTSVPLAGTTLMHTYSAAGTYTVVVTATDTSGLTGSAQQQVTPNQLPVCTLGVIQGTAATYAVSVPASCVDPQSLALTTAIDWGDGTIAPATNNAANTHTYGASGTYSVTLTGADTAGLVGVSAPQPVNVLVQAAPIAPGGSTSVTGTTPAPPAATVGTQVTFICSSVSFVFNGQTVNNALPSRYGISCTSPTVTLTPAPTPVNVTIQTTTAPTSAANRSAETTTAFWAVVFPLPGLALLGLGTVLGGRRRRRWNQWMAIAMVAVLCFGLTSCGGSFTPPPVASTPEGQYYVTVLEQVVNQPPPTGFVQTSLIVPLPVTNSGGN